MCVPLRSVRPSTLALVINAISDRNDGGRGAHVRGRIYLYYSR